MAPTTEPPPDEDEEDDYLSMTFIEPHTSNTKKESLVEQTKRKAREAEERGRPKSKAELAVSAASKRDAGLSTNLLLSTATSTSDSPNGDAAAATSKGAKMMAKLGYKPGTALGAGQGGLLEPVGVEMKEGRGGVGADAEKKRKIREEFERVEGEEKRRKVDALEYRERQAREREEKRVDGLVWGAMKVAEGLEEGDEEDGKTRKRKVLQDVSVLWRGLVKERAIVERDKRMRYDLHQSLSRRPEYNDPDEDADDQIALGKKDTVEEVELDLDEEDQELEAFEALPAAEKLGKLVAYLREKWHYCFWCKFKYPDEAMEGCPGATEDEHG